MNPLSVNAIGLAPLALEEQLTILSELSSDYVGLTVASFEQAGWTEATRAVKQSQLKISYLCHGVQARADDPQAWALEVERLQRAIDAASAIGAPYVYFTTGRLGQLTWEEAAAQLVVALEPLTKYAAARQVRLVLENTMSIRSDISFTHTLRDTVRVARAVGALVCVDLYCCWTESGLAETLEDALEVAAIVQISDVSVEDLQLPNRRVPGDGDIPLSRLVSMVRKLGYTGIVDIELLGPEITREGALKALKRAEAWTRDTLSA